MNIAQQTNAYANLGPDETQMKICFFECKETITYLKNKLFFGIKVKYLEDT